MHSRQLLAWVGLFLVLSLSSAATRAADLLDKVPSDALGFVVVKNLAATNAKIERLLTTLQAEFPGPLAFLQAATGVSDGLDHQGDFLLVVLPAAATGGEPQFAVWLPVQDYDRLMATLGGAPGQKIAGVTIGGEDLLIARDESWALVMDPDQRPRMEQILVGAAKPPAAIAEWHDWIDDHDVAAVFLPSGIRYVLVWAAAGVQNHPANQSDDDIFNFGQTDISNNPFAATPNNPAAQHGVDQSLRGSIRKWSAASPQFTFAVLHSRLFGCALRLDAQGNLQAGFRAAGAGKHLSKGSRDDEQPPPPAIYRGGNFVLHGAGRLPPLLLSSVTGAYVWAIVDELKTAEGMVLRGPTVAQFRAAVAQASANVQSLVVLTQPGDKPVGVYTNDFLVVRAASAQAFTDNAKEVMRLWNSMNRDAQAATKLVFDVEEVKLGERTATQYSLDIAAADGAPALPEIRQAMEQLFGPGGKLRLWIVPVDDRNALLASGTQEQVASALQSLDREQPIDWSHAELSAANSLLPADADWRLFFSPHDYNRWHRRQMDAVTGPVIGGPLVKDFPSAPPIGVAGGIRRDELWLEAAIPAETIKSAGIYLKK